MEFPVFHSNSDVLKTTLKVIQQTDEINIERDGKLLHVILEMHRRKFDKFCNNVDTTIWFIYFYAHSESKYNIFCKDHF